jgi:hypothetical protein
MSEERRCRDERIQLTVSLERGLEAKIRQDELVER